MSFSYDNTLPTDLDWVRFNLPDKIGPAADAIYQNEEITALINEQIAKDRTGLATKYYASAAALRNLAGEFALVGGGLRRKEVDDLEVEFGLQTGAVDMIDAKIKALIADGNRCLVPRPRLAFAMGSVSHHRIGHRHV